MSVSSQEVPNEPQKILSYGFSRYIEFMKNWTENEMPDFMEVAFSAERSIQDEIERESYGEITTILISYLVMFAYITIALMQGLSRSSNIMVRI